jgi:hypothetical protein
MGNSGHGQSSDALSNCRMALLLTLALRIAYSSLAALFGLFLPVNWNLIHSNALTETLPPPNHGAHYLMLGIWERFDTLWYLHIARYGYDRPDAIVFYPLYPFLIRIVSWLVQPIAASLLISTLAAFFLFWGFQKLLGMDFDSDAVRKSLIVYAVWPSSFILFAGYPESLLLALLLWSWYFARKEKWAAAVMLAVAAEMTKAVGVIITIPLFLMAVRRQTASAWSVPLVPLGALAFPAWVRWSGHGSISYVYQYYWRTKPAAPWTTLWVAAEHLLHRPEALLVLNLLFLLVICVLVGLSRARLEYKVFALAAILLVLCKQTDPPLQSMMRYLLVVFPAFVGGAQVLETPPWKPRFWPVCAGLLTINLALIWLFLGWSLVL